MVINATSSAGRLMDELARTEINAMPVAFHFRVWLNGVLPPLDCSFQEVSGIEQTMQTEDVVCGGENRFVYKLPTGMHQNNLVLKRGIATLASPLYLWCRSVLEGGLSIPIVPMGIHVHLLNADRLPVRAWMFHDAYPVKWSVDAFNATKNDVVIESIELAYLHSTRVL
ncbi:phage tail protein [Paludibacterium paludis]|uniref:Phage tail protein n=1 Tax=Paludibacterium paludis TaxID=1225769 RepID=A0A918U918_9NEIS|nr:phage tail protein [Paludibacterium paludis]GGY13815.1 phage tail protein [Paludibacterium paludis]